MSKRTAVWMLAGLMGAGLVRAQQSVYPQTTMEHSASRERQPGQLKGDDYDFVVTASRIDMEEVQMGELAQRQGASEQVRNYGERMVREHSKSSTKLQQLATQKGATVPTQLSTKDADKIEHLQGLSGAKFDKEYAEHMVKGHTKAIKEYKAASKDLSDPDLRIHAETSLPTLEEHLRMAKELEESVKKAK